MLVDLCPARSDAWRGWKASGGDVGRRQARGQPRRGRDHTYRAATRNRRERGRVCWSGWSTWWSERMPCSSAAPWGPLDAPGRGPQSTENRPLCEGCESKVRGRRQPQNSRELAPMGWWTRPYAQTPVVWVPPDHLPRTHSDPRHLTSRDSNIRPKLREAVKAMRPVKFYGTWPGFVN